MSALQSHVLLLPYPTRDPGADQMIPPRAADAVENVRSDEIIVGDTAHERLIEPLRFTAIASHK